MGTRGLLAVLLAALCAVVTGCAAPAPSAPPAPAAPDDSDQFREAVRRTTASSFVTTSLSEIHQVVLAVDPATDRRRSVAAYVLNGSVVGIEVRVIGDDTWFSVSGSSEFDPAAWHRVDTDRVGGTPLELQPDGGLRDLAASVHGVTAAGSTLTGMLLMADPRQPLRAQLGVPSRVAVPFAAEVDDAGRLSKLTTDGRLAGSRAISAQSAFSAFGKPVVVEPPPTAAVKEATDEMLKALTGG
jgi:hypothetical protein